MPLAIEGNQAVAGRLEQGAVVADQQQGTVVAAVFRPGCQGLLEPLRTGNVEVVGGFVEDQDVVRTGHQARDHRAGALPARQRCQGLLLRLATEEERAREVAGLLLVELLAV